MIKQNFIEKIACNIEKFNFHVTAVQSGKSPRFAYTIGNLEKLDFELVFAGGVNFLNQDLSAIFNTIIPSLNKQLNLDEFVAPDTKKKNNIRCKSFRLKSMNGLGVDHQWQTMFFPAKKLDKPQD